MTIQTIPVGPLHTNCYLVYDDQGDGVVVDPGGEADTLLCAIASSGMRVRYVLLTHAHVDHMAAAAAILEATGANLLLHEGDAPALTDPSWNLSSLFPELCDGPLPVLKADRLLREGDTVEAGTLRFTVLHTPGHTPGSCCYLCGDVLFSGDTLFQDGCGRTDFPGGSKWEMLQSLARLRELPEACRVYPGHGGETTNH